MSLAQSITDVVKKLDQIKKSVSIEKTAHKDDDDLKRQEEASKSEQAEKPAKDVKLSDENEKATKKVKKADDDGIDSDVEESAKSAKEEKCGPEAPEEDKSKKSAKDDKDEAEESDAKKSTDAKVEEAKAKQAKKLSNVEDPAGHEQASKSVDAQQALNALSKAVDTMAELQKSYIKLAESKLAKSVEAPEVEKSVKKDGAEKCGDGNEVDLSAKKSTKEEKCNNNADSVNNPDVDAKSAKKSAKDGKEDADTDDEEKCDASKDDKAKKSVPASKAVSVASIEVEDAKENDDSAKKSITMGDFKNVLIKSMGDLNGAQLSESIRQDRAIKSLYNKVRYADDDAPVSDELVKKYNEI